MSSCRPSTASMSSSATCITSMRWKTRRIPTIRRICSPPSARATWSTRWATDIDDPTEQPRWGKIGKQKIEDAGTLYPERMKTVDDEILDNALKFVDKARADGKPFFLWLNPTRMHVVTHLSDKYEAMRNSENGWSEEEAGMAQLDDIVGSVMKYVKDNGLDDDTIVAFSTDNGTENFTWPDGGQTPFAGGKGTALEGGFRAPAIIRWPGKVPAGKVENGIMSGLDWFPTFVAAAGNPNIVDELKAGKQLGDTTYKVHLDGYNQMDLITGKGPSARHEIYYFTESTLSAVRINDYKYRFTDQPNGWLGATEKVDWPILVNLRLDPFERTGMYNGKDNGSIAYYNWFAYQFWRFQFVQQQVAKLAKTGDRVPAHAKGRELQSRSRESADRESDRGTARTIDPLLPGARLEWGPVFSLPHTREPPMPGPFSALARRALLWGLLILVLFGFGSPPALAQANPLPSWNDGPAKSAIVDFVARVTRPGGPDYVAPEERIATFDNDGTLWAEQPVYFQLAFALDRIKALAPQHPEWDETQPFKSVLEGDTKAVAASGEKGLLEIMAATHAGITTESSPTSSTAGSRPPSIRASIVPTPSSSTSRCWNCSPICAPTASRPSSCRAAASSSCARSPSASTASRPSRWSARRAS